MKNRELDKIENKLRSVLRSCKTEEQIQIFGLWAYKLYYNISDDLKFEQLIWCDNWVKSAVDEQKEYLRKLNEL